MCTGLELMTATLNSGLANVCYVTKKKVLENEFPVWNACLGLDGLLVNYFRDIQCAIVDPEGGAL